MRSSLHTALYTSTLALACAAAACGDLGEIALGGDDTDGFRLADTANMAHIAASLDGGADLTFTDLFNRGDGAVFLATPDPGTLLTGMNTADDARARDGRAPLSVLSYNVALLSVQLVGVIPYAETPDLEARRRALPGLVFETGADVILCQEVWLPEDVAHFSERAVEHGYRPFVHERREHNDGLMSFIREDAIAGGTTPSFTFAPYGAQVGTEFFPGPGIKRGWLGVRFVHAGVGVVHAYNTHMQAFPENWLGRLKQARELGIEARQAGANGDIVVVAGDLNSGPYYAQVTWTLPDGSVSDRWLHNAIAYPSLLTYGGLVDAAIMGRRAGDAIADITLGDTVVNDPGNALTIPGAEEGWCARTPPTTFTATDCNSLYFDQYAGTEFPARLDHIMVSDSDRVVAASSAIVFTEPERFGAVTREPSDHFGVRVDFLVTPR